MVDVYKRQVYDKSDEGQGSFLILQNFNYEGFGKEDGIVVIEIDKAQIKTCLLYTSRCV